jgi:hypothetical protein
MNFAPYIVPVALTVVLLILMRLQANSAQKSIRKAEDHLHALEQKLASTESSLKEEIRKSGEEKDLKITQLHEDLRAALKTFMESTSKSLAESEATAKAQNEQVIEKVTTLLRQVVRKPEQGKESPPPQQPGVSPMHEKAKRLAVSSLDIILYNQARSKKNPEQQLLRLWLTTFRRQPHASRVPEEIRKETAYLDDAFNDLIDRKKRELSIT